MDLFALFIACFLSATVIPFSSDIVLFTAFSLDYHVTSAITVAAIGNTLGLYTNYFIGRGIIQLKRKKNIKEENRKWEFTIQRYGYWLGFISWVPFVGEAITIGLGLAKVKFKFLAITIAIGATTRYIILYLVYLGTLG